MCIRRDVVVLRLAAEQQIANAAAHEIGFEARSLQFSAYIRREFARSHAAIMRPNREAKGIQMNV
jgi:hypothetical protein